ncbi:MAG: hypothetical protein QM778_19660 [Myxococcales bacterium]
MRGSAYLTGFCSLILTPLGACSDPPPTTSSAPLPSDSDDEPEMECEPNDEEACDCPDGSESTRACFDDGTWSVCNCEEPEQPSDTGFVGDCKPGRYEGEFFGYYYSQFTVGWSAIPVWALSLDGKPGLAFTLNSSGKEPVPGEEFYDELEISDGYVRGTADGLFPFEGKLTGKLDCKTKEFKATLSGGYAILVKAVLNEAKFEGPVLGKYDVKTSSFPCQNGVKTFPKCDGSVEVRATDVVADMFKGTPFPKPDFPSNWSLLELNPVLPPILPFPYGGGGYWSAQWVGAGSVDTNTGKPMP